MWSHKKDNTERLLLFLSVGRNNCPSVIMLTGDWAVLFNHSPTNTLTRTLLYINTVFKSCYLILLTQTLWVPTSPALKSSSQVEPVLLFFTAVRCALCECIQKSLSRQVWALCLVSAGQVSTFGISREVIYGSSLLDWCWCCPLLRAETTKLKDGVCLTPTTTVFPFWSLVDKKTFFYGVTV